MYWDDDWAATSRSRGPTFSLGLVMPPILDVITVADARAHVRIPSTDQDEQIGVWVRAATRKLEQDTELALLTQTWELTLTGFPSWPDPIVIPRRPIQTIASVKYYDTAGVLQTVTNTDYLLDAWRPRIGLAQTKYWPAALRTFQPVVIRFDAGYMAPDLVPEDLKHAVRLLVGHFSEQFQATQAGNRPQSIDLGYEALIAPYVLHRVA